MPKLVKDIISDLESSLLDPPSFKNSVRTSDGHIVRLERTLWTASPVLQGHITREGSYLTLEVARNTLTDLLDAHKNRKIPADFPRLLNLLACCSLLELHDLTPTCLHALFRSGKLDREAYPSECSTDTVLDIFGKHFNLETLEVDRAFYLKYGSYLLYPSDEVVYRKSLRDDGDPVEVLRGVSHLLVRENFVFAIQVEGERDSVALWMNDQFFSKIFQADSTIHSIDFDTAHRILAIKLGGNSKRFFELQDNFLITLSQELTCRLEDLWLFRGRSKRFPDGRYPSRYLNLRNVLRLIKTMRRTDAEKSGMLKNAFVRKILSFLGAEDPLDEAIRLTMRGETVYTRRARGLYVTANSPSCVVLHTILDEGEVWTGSCLWISSLST